jgi:uncharacterized membrane protein YiaA
VTETETADERYERTRASQEQPDRPAPARVALFVLCMLLLLAGFWLMGVGVDNASITFFLVGVAFSGMAFFLALHRPER